MLTILSPAKNMRAAASAAVPAATAPRFATQTSALYRQLCALAPYEIESLMRVSPALALRACADFAAWQPDGGAPALLAYDGLAYRHLDAASLSGSALEFAQAHLRILSAFYGVLRPLDLIRPYRLEMAHKPAGQSLYRFWGDALYRDLFAQGQPVVNLASGEYSRAVSPHLRPGDQLITCEFLTFRKGKLQCLATVAKMARGRMARYILERRADDPALLTGFDWDGFAFEPALSSQTTLAFVQTPS